MPRAPKPIDTELLKKLASIMCTWEEMSVIMGVDVATLHRRCAKVIKEGREHGKMSLRREQWKAAMSGNTKMLIWLGIQHLGQRADRQGVQQQAEDEQLTREVPAMTKEQALQLVHSRQEKKVG